jgi:DNA-binding response OmpR family regulator/DNA-binding CsgD family transcriptional regulator
MTIFDNKTILVADDDPGNRELVVSTMSRLASGVKVLSAAHGGNVMDILTKRSVDAVLLDWEMPVMDGFETLKKIRESEKGKYLPILMYTGVMTATANLVKALDAGATDFIRKPTEPVELIARIKSSLTFHDEFSRRLRLEQENAAMRNKLLQHEIENLKAELSNYLAQLARKNEVLVEVREMLSINDRDKAMRHIEGIINGESYWDDFFQRFSSFDNRFLEIISNHPGSFSTTEIKFCTLIRLGMSSKDIAALLNITPAAIEKKRYRIRKKFNLETEDSLEKHVMGLGN